MIISGHITPTRGGTANKLNVDAGSATKPVYFKDGIPVETTHTLGASVPSDAKFTDTTYSEATESAAGLMSAADKAKLDNIEANANKTVVDSELSDASTNPVQNKVIKGELDDLRALVGDQEVTVQIETKITDLNLDGTYAPKDAQGYVSNSKVGASNGVAELDASGKVPASQLPSYVDDVLEYATKSAFPVTGETGKIYVDTTNNKTYRWGGSAYVEISASLALGATSSTAFRGDYGSAAYTHSQVTSGNPHGVTKSDIGLGNVENKSSATIRGELTEGNVTSALGYSPASKTVASSTTDGLMSASDKTSLTTLASYVGDKPVAEQINAAIAHKSQVQFITWEEND